MTPDSFPAYSPRFVADLTPGGPPVELPEPGYYRIEPDHPEAFCGRCGGTNPQWVAPSPLWNAVMRGGSINGGQELCGGIVCPSCFANLATEAGIANDWRLTAEDVRAPLETVTPSGRVWNSETWLWEDKP